MYFLTSGKVGGLTDLTSAAAANGLLVGISQDHLESSKSVSRLYGTQHMTGVASAYPENIQGMGFNVLIFRHFDYYNSKIMMIKGFIYQKQFHFNRSNRGSSDMEN